MRATRHNTGIALYKEYALFNRLDEECTVAIV